MAHRSLSEDELRRYRNSRLYRSLARVLRAYNRRLLERIRERGFRDFAASFPSLLSNLDTEGTRIGVLARRAGITRQAAGQLLGEIERCGYARRGVDPDDARAVLVRFTSKGRRLLATVLELVEEIEGELARTLGDATFEVVRANLQALADDIDPAGALGTTDRSE